MPTIQTTRERPIHPLLVVLTPEELRQVQLTRHECLCRRDERLYGAGEEADCMFAVTSGVIKMVRTTADRRSRIVGLLRKDDVAGMEALASNTYDNDAIAITDVHGYRLCAAALHRLSARSIDLNTTLMRRWHRALKSADDWLTDLNVGPAGMRVRQFLLRMRSAADPSLTTLFSREDMGAMMGLKLETVSRELTALVRAGLIQQLDSPGRTYRILDEARLTPRPS